MPRVSVCMGVYNGAATIRSALSSVLAQTFSDYEILVVDDGSTDDSSAIAESFGARVIRQENAGLGAVRRRLMEEARGDLVAFIDHDDDWVPDKLEKQIRLFDDPKVVLVHSDCWYLYEDGRRVERNLTKQFRTSFDHILPNNLVIASSAVFSRNEMLAAGNFIPETVRCSDWHGWLILAPRGKFVHLPEKQVEYRVLSSSLANAGYRFQEAKRFLLKDIIQPIESTLFRYYPEGARKRYHRMIQQNIGIAASTMAKFLDKEGKHKEASQLHREAMKLAGSVPRVALRAIKSKLGG